LISVDYSINRPDINEEIISMEIGSHDTRLPTAGVLLYVPFYHATILAALLSFC
jgi:hypothetical protein